LGRDVWGKEERLAEAAGNLAHLIEREAKKAPDEEPRVSLEPLAEIVGDKGYHSNDAVMHVQQAQGRSYIPEPRRGGRQWAGKADEQQAVYANRRRVKGNYGKRLLKKRGELIERSFAHCYQTGAMRRVYLRGRENILKRQLIHVGAFNLSLIFRQTLGAGTPRQLRNRLILAIFWLSSAINVNSAVSRRSSRLPQHRTGLFRHHRRPICRSRLLGFSHGLLVPDILGAGIQRTLPAKKGSFRLP
jgi:hypothetical protein